MTYKNHKNLARHWLPPTAHPQQPKGFSLVEVIITSVVFTLVAVGLLATISVLSKASAGSSRAMTATWLGKGLLDNLRPAVDAETWGQPGNPLTDVINSPLSNVTVGNYTYSPKYTVTTDPETGGRYVTMTVTWEE